MVNKVHEHIIEELKTNTRTDIVFVLTAIILNLVTLAINSAIAASDELSWAFSLRSSLSSIW